MFIKNLNKDISRIVHNNVTYKVVKGIADVPQEVRDHLINFPDWHDLVEEVDDEILKLVHADNTDEDSSDGKGPNLTELRDKAKELGVTGAARMKKEDLISAIEEASKQTSQE